MSFSTLGFVLLSLGPLLLLEAPAAAHDRPYDGLQELWFDEASGALAQGRYLRAEQLFWRLTKADPDDARALREAGRAAFALGNLAYAERALGQVEVLRGDVPDPEIRYLRAQALLALGRRKEGEVELAEAERQLSPVPPDRQSTLWLARIYALRRDVTRSEAMYRTQLPSDPTTPEYAEVMLYIVEARVLAGDWRGAQLVLDLFLADQPQNERGLQMLAWVFEGNGKIEEELLVRAELAEEWRDHRQHVLGYARALERANDDASALAMYREADRLGAGDAPGLERTARRQSPELSAGIHVDEDLSGSKLGWGAGATVPFGSGLRLAVTGSGASAKRVPVRGALQPPEGVMSTSVGAQLLLNRRGYLFAAGPTLTLPGVANSLGFGGSVAARTPQARPFELRIMAQVGQPWRETTATVSEGGVTDGARVEAFAKLFSDRIVFSVTAEGRRLALEPMEGLAAPHALQLFGAAGVDFVLWARPHRVARGQILDDDMMWPTTLSSGLVVSYRHYELFSQDPFGERLVLVDRSRIEEASVAIRHVLDDAGAVGFELHGGIGPDTSRGILTSRAGGALLISATAGTRLTASYDFASQIGTGPSGLRHTAGVTFHVDL